MWRTTGSDTVSVIDTATHMVTHHDPRWGTLPLGVAVTPAAAATVYVTNAGSDTVSVVDPATHMVTHTIAVEDAPLGVAVTSGGDAVYVVNAGSDTVSVHRSRPPTR